jgi:hypothetical protein
LRFPADRGADILMPDKEKRSATVGEAHVTNKISELIFQRSLPAGWLPRKQEPDFHIDYKVELVEAGELSGINFGVQLKGWVPKKGRRKGPCYSLSTKHLRYYVEKCTLPIFLVLVDVTAEKCYWVFVQQHAKEKLKPNWENQKKIMVHFSERDELSGEQLIAIIRTANDYVRELHPGSVQAAVSHQKTKFEAKYPQLFFDVSYGGGKMHLDVQPKGEMPLTIRVPAEVHLKAIQECFEKGKDVQFSTTGVQFVGSPFFDEHVNEKPGLVRLLKEPIGHGEAQISWTDETGPAFLVIPGKFKRGSKFITFQGGLDGSPLALETWFSPQALDQGQVPNSHFLFGVHHWHGKQVLGLPYFEQIRKLFGRKQAGLPMRFELFFEGNSVGHTSFHEPDPKRIEPMCMLLNFLDKARRVVRHFEINPCLSERISATDLISVNELYDLIVSKRHDYSVTGQTFTLSMREPSQSADMTGQTLSMTAELDKVYSIFQTRFCVGVLRETTSDIRFVSQGRNTEGIMEFHFAHSDPSKVTVMPAGEKLTKQPMPDVTQEPTEHTAKLRQHP